MKTILPPLKGIENVIGTQNGSTDSFVVRKTKFCVECTCDDGVLMYNTLTKQCVLIEPNDSESVVNRFLYENWFLVPQSFMEMNFCDEFHELWNITKEQLKGYTTYTILTTTDCNAHCFYCYEKGQAHRKMSDDVALKVASFISTTCNKEYPVLLCWFGGEPLYNKGAIDIICEELSKSGIEYRSDITTNGFLFDDKVICDAKGLWKVKCVQITLDGTEDVYNKVKSYVYKDVNAYRRVIDNIRLLLDADIKVHIRINVDMYNLENASQLLDELGRMFNGDKKLLIYCHPLFENCNTKSKLRTQEQRKAIAGFIKKANDKIQSFGFAGFTPGLCRRIRENNCMADSENSIVIMPDGYLGKCNSYTDSNYIGHIDNDNLNEDMLRKFRKRRDKISECSECPIYPECTRLEMCQESQFCYEEMRERWLEDTKQAMLNEYHAFLEREKENVNNDGKVS